MIFFILHHIIHNTPVIKDWKESKKNITTFLVGSVLYVFLLSFLQSNRYASLVNGTFVLFTLKNWFLWIIGIDITAMAIIYKNFWGRTILDELPETWTNRRPKIPPVIPPTAVPAVGEQQTLPLLANNNTNREEYLPRHGADSAIQGHFTTQLDDIIEQEEETDDEEEDADMEESHVNDQHFKEHEGNTILQEHDTESDRVTDMDAQSDTTDIKEVLI